MVAGRGAGVAALPAAHPLVAALLELRRQGARSTMFAMSDISPDMGNCGKANTKAPTKEPDICEIPVWKQYATSGNHPDVTERAAQQPSAAYAYKHNSGSRPQPVFNSYTTYGGYYKRVRLGPGVAGVWSVGREVIHKTTIGLGGIVATIDADGGVSIRRKCPHWFPETCVAPGPTASTYTSVAEAKTLWDLYEYETRVRTERPQILGRNFQTVTRVRVLKEEKVKKCRKWGRLGDYPQDKGCDWTTNIPKDHNARRRRCTGDECSGCKNIQEAKKSS